MLMRATGDHPVANERLRIAIANAQVDIDQIAEATKVDPKTVQRWLAGRVPQPVVWHGPSLSWDV